MDYAASYAYADSISDLDLLRMVGHPVAVYPDAPLAALARERNWEVLA
jgi:phosphoserine phosphatase